MAKVGRYDNPFLSFEFLGSPPAGSTATVSGLETADRAATRGVLWLPAGERPSTVLAFMHPRVDFTRHYAVPALLEAGYAVWTQCSRWVGNDSMLVHERVLYDVAAGMQRLRDLGFDHLVAVGNSGGGSLYTFYAAQAARPGQRLKATAAGAPIDLDSLEMPRIDAMVYLAAHPGEGAFLMKAIDPSVVDENDPVGCDPALDLYDPANGFRPPPEPSRYEADFLERYRRAQQARVRRIDDRCRRQLAVRQQARARLRENPDDRDAARTATAVSFLTVYRTEADPRTVDLSIDPSRRDYGSLFGRRPDLINYGPFGFARVVTPDAWLSTWSGLSSHAELAAHAPGIHVPCLAVGYTADNAVFPSDLRAIVEALGTKDKTALEVEGDHYGHPAAAGGQPGRAKAVAEIVGWLRARGL